MHHHVTKWRFRHEPLGPGYSGSDTYRESEQTITTADGQVSIGAWRHDGPLHSSRTMHAHQIWVIAKGSAKIEIEGESMTLTTGSVVCFEAPYGPKILEAADGFEAVWIGVPQKDAGRA